MSHRQRRGEEKEDVDMIRFRKTFEELSGQDMEVDAWELRDILNSSLRQDLRRDRFSEDSCKSMVALSDEDRTGKLSFDEFRELWDHICEWKELFKKADTDNSGMISTNEMRASLTSLGFKLKNDTFRALGLLYGNKEGNLSFASFIHVAIRVKFMYTTFESKSRGDKARFNLEELLMVYFYS
ncbi:calpain small subunit 1-like [Strongylocentrotus purpuratus]|uniref:EF-hand domain-containing protein n=1 Tax=Strongylocentrotus purpuratus TaxID=7668 RepID=A0A7M7PRY0_STRPU|nr:calpain small subunit 1-like [Strongylocentrotus purpuratus]